jgi:phosphatidylinositol-4,5-bisphosphate 3-kinase catalytic subunit alpha/beta/delta
MLCTGIPELRSADDVEYLRMAFGIGLTEEQASKHFTALIHSSLRTKTTVINDAIHVWVHS